MRRLARLGYHPHPLRTRVCEWSDVEGNRTAGAILEEAGIPRLDTLGLFVQLPGGAEIEATAETVIGAGATLIARRRAGLTPAVIFLLMALYAGVWTAHRAVRFLKKTLFSVPKFGDGLGGTPGRKDVRGFSNEQRPYESVPLVLGTHRIYPDYAAPPYISVHNGGDVYQHHLFAVARNKCNVSDLRFGEQSILADVAIQYAGGVVGRADSPFSDVYIEIRKDWDPASTTVGDPIKSYPGSVFDERVGLRAKRGDSGGVVRTTKPNTSSFVVQVSFPHGLGAVGKNGTAKPVTAKWQVHYRAVGASKWTLGEAVTTKGKQQGALYRQVRVDDLTSGSYEVRVRHVSLTHASGLAAVFSNLHWESLQSFGAARAIADGATGMTIVAMRVRHSRQLSGILENFNLVASSLMDDWTGAAWAEAETSNPASHIRYILQGDASKRTVADARIDLTQIQAFHDRCDAAGFEVNTIIRNRIATADLLERIANVGRASMATVDSQFSVVIDDPADTTPVQVFSARNVRGFRGERAYVQPVHAFRVIFRNRAKDWVEDERVVFNDGYTKTNATEYERLEAWGVTDEDQAYTLGRWAMAVSELRAENFTFEVDFEHWKVLRGSVVRLQHHGALLGLSSGRIKEVAQNVGGDATGVTVDNACPMVAATTYELRVRKSDATLVRAEITLGVGDQTVLDFTSDIDSADPQPVAGDLWVFGAFATGLENSLLCRVREIHPRGKMGAKIVLEPLAAAAHDADTGTIPSYSSHVQYPPAPQAKVPTTPNVQQATYTQAELDAIRQIKAANQAKLRINVTNAGTSAA